MTVTAQDGQSIFDIALQQYGTLEGCIDVVFNNESIANLNSNLHSGQVLTVQAVNNVTVNRFSLNNTVINTSDPKLQDATQYSNAYDESYG